MDAQSCTHTQPLRDDSGGAEVSQLDESDRVCVEPFLADDDDDDEDDDDDDDDDDLHGNGRDMPHQHEQDSILSACVRSTMPTTICVASVCVSSECGSMLVIDSVGVLYGKGPNRNGQLGLGDNIERKLLCCVPCDGSVREADITDMYSTILTNVGLMRAGSSHSFVPVDKELVVTDITAFCIEENNLYVALSRGKAVVYPLSGGLPTTEDNDSLGVGDGEHITHWIRIEGGSVVVTSSGRATFVYFDVADVGGLFCRFNKLAVRRLENCFREGYRIADVTYGDVVAVALEKENARMIITVSIVFFTAKTDSAIVPDVDIREVKRYIVASGYTFVLHHSERDGKGSVYYLQNRLKENGWRRVPLPSSIRIRELIYNRGCVCGITDAGSLLLFQIVDFLEGDGQGDTVTGDVISWSVVPQTLPGWSPSLHHLYPREVQDVVFTILLAWNASESGLQWMPAELIRTILAML